jgi:hypothetical protein
VVAGRELAVARHACVDNEVEDDDAALLFDYSSGS